MMNTAFIDSLRLILNFLIQRGALTSEEAELLYEILLLSERTRTEQDDFLLFMDKAYLTDKISYRENYEERLKAGCAELSIDPKDHTEAARSLLESGVLTEKRSGIAPAEPSHQVPLEILLRRSKMESIIGYIPTFIKWSSHLLGSTGIIVPLPTRRRLVSEITYKLPNSASILFSKSPSVFNPMEFESTYSNHTQYFAEVVGNVSQPLFYFWNLDAVCSQIQQHLNEVTPDVDQLMDRYTTHFAQYAKNKDLVVICSSNSAIQENWEVMPFISADYLVKGEREDGKLVAGAMVNRKRLGTYLDLLPAIGRWARPVVEAVFEERYDRLRRNIIDDPHAIVL
jgi:hypothetical protein